MRRSRDERGIALVMVLLVLTLLTIVTTQFAFTTQVYSHLARNSVNGLQASLLARSGLNLGEAVLLYDTDNTVDSFLEEWCPEADEDACRVDDSLFELPERLRLRIKIYDEGGKLNLNLTRPLYTEYRRKQLGIGGDQQVFRYEILQAALRTLLEAEGADPDAADRLGEYWNNMIGQLAGNAGLSSGEASQTPGQSGAGGGGQNNAAQDSQMQAILNEHNFPSLEDANVVLGLDPRVVQRLRRYLTALPVLTQTGRINVNTAPRRVLEAILGDPGATDSIVFQRQTAPVLPGDIASLTQGVDPDRFRHVVTMLGSRSDVFRIQASALVNADPLTGEGGLARSASIVVRRFQAQPKVRGGNSEQMPWTLTRLDWQKEGGAVLFEEESSDETGEPEDDDRASF